METIKAKILKVISEEHTSIYKFIRSCQLDVELDESIESQLVQTLTDAIMRWADARETMHKSLTSLIRTATDQKQKIQSGLDVQSGWIDSNRYKETIAEAKMWETEISTLTRLVGLQNTDRVNLFKKLNSLIQF